MAIAEGTISIQQSVLLAGAGLALVIVLGWGRRRRSLNGSPKQYRREIDAANGQGRAVRQDLEKLLIELQACAGQVNGQIEAKIASLEQSARGADRRIEALRHLIDAANSAGGSAEGAARIEETGDRMVVGGEARYLGVYELADRGLSAEEIARRLGRATGEIELILRVREPLQR